MGTKQVGGRGTLVECERKMIEGNGREEDRSKERISKKGLESKDDGKDLRQVYARIGEKRREVKKEQDKQETTAFRKIWIEEKKTGKAEGKQG